MYKDRSYKDIYKADRPKYIFNIIILAAAAAHAPSRDVLGPYRLSR
jgi:hypothetical protein